MLDKDGNPIQEKTSEGVQTVGAEPTMKYTEQVIDKSRRVCPLSTVMVEMLVKQNLPTMLCI